MSEVLSGSPAGTIYGTYALAVIYVDSKYGDAYRAWELLSAPDRKRALLSAAAYLNRQAWNEDYDTFAERDALQAFIDASYELGVLIVGDPDIVQAADQGSNIQSVNAGGAGVTYFNPTSRGRGASLLPPVLEALIGQYLVAASGDVYGGTGQSGSCVNPFSSCQDDDRGDPW